MKIFKKLFILLILLGSLTIFGCSLLEDNPTDNPVVNPTDDPVVEPSDEPVVEPDILPKKVEILNKVSELTIGDELVLDVAVSPDDAKNKEVKFLSSDDSVATIDSGIVKALKEGTVKISVYCVADNTIKDEFDLKVLQKEEEGPNLPEDYTLIKDLKNNLTAKVYGTVCGVNKESFLISDETGIILVYLGNTWKCDVEVGDVLIVNGTITSYGKALQFGKTSTYTKESHIDFTYPDAIKVDGTTLDNYLKKDSVNPTLIEVVGELTQSGSYFNMTVNGANKAVVSLTYPITPTSLSNYIGKEITVKGYFTGISSSKYINILFTDIKLKENDTLSYSDYELSYREYIYSVLGNDVVIYSSDDINPYGIDLDIYGDDVYAVFCEYDVSNATDPYSNVNKDEFYNNYTEANSYIDSYFRSKHGLMSGDITPQGHIPNKLNIKDEELYVACTRAFYVLTFSGGYIGYLPNDLEGNFQMIWYGGAYTSLNEVSAYLLAFGEVPINSNYDKSSGKGQCIIDFGIYGRVNKDVMIYDSSKWPYEPEMPRIMEVEYTETDVGTLGGYTSENKITGTKYTQKLYNTGTTINRGAARLCFISDKNIKSINERKVFYTYNHYNDFEEYLNYNNGFGKRFGCESAGNEYCGSSSDYYKSATNPPTQYERVLAYSLEQILALGN